MQHLSVAASRHNESNAADYRALLSEFNRRFPTYVAIWRALCLKAVQTGLVQCRHCSDSSLIWRDGSRVLQCENCEGYTWITSGTIFHRMRKPRPWLLAIWLQERGVLISGARLARMARVAQSTAAVILKKLACVVGDYMYESASKADSISFRKSICKRSRETPARMHPRDEECEPLADEMSNHPSQSPTVNLDTRETTVVERLSRLPVSFDELLRRTGMSIQELSSILAILEIYNLINRLPGNNIVLATELPTRALNSKLSSNFLVEFYWFIRDTHHGISRKYLQHYLASHWSYLSRNRWKRGVLLDSCWRAGPVFYRQLLEYVTPSVVLVGSKL